MPSGFSFLPSRRARDDPDNESLAPSVYSLPPYSPEPISPAADLVRSASLGSQLQSLQITSTDRSQLPFNPGYNNTSTSIETINPPSPLSARPGRTPTPTSAVDRYGGHLDRRESYQSFASDHSYQSNQSYQSSQSRQSSQSHQPYASTSISQTQSRPLPPQPPTIRERSAKIEEALEIGEAIVELHNRTLFSDQKAKHEFPIQTRLQNVYLGQLIMKMGSYIRKIRSSGCISDNSERVLFNRALQFCLKLQNKEFTIAVFYTNMLIIVQDMQNVLSKHHLELGIEDLVTGINDIDNLMQLRNITQ